MEKEKKRGIRLFFSFFPLAEIGETEGKSENKDGKEKGMEMGGGGGGGRRLFFPFFRRRFGCRKQRQKLR